MVLAAATLSNQGVRPAPRLAIALDTPAQGWVVLPALSNPEPAFTSTQAAEAAQKLILNDHPFWQWTSQASEGNQDFSWSLGGTLPDYQGVPLAVVVLLEENNSTWAGLIASRSSH